MFKKLIFFCPSIEEGGVEKNLIILINNLVKKYDLSVSHSGGGCFHVEMSLGEDQILINPYNKDVEYDIPKSNKSRCIFGIYKDGEEKHKTFIGLSKDIAILRFFQI